MSKHNCDDTRYPLGPYDHHGDTRCYVCEPGLMPHWSPPAAKLQERKRAVFNGGLLPQMPFTPSAAKGPYSFGEDIEAYDESRPAFLKATSLYEANGLTPPGVTIPKCACQGPEGCDVCEPCDDEKDI